MPWEAGAATALVAASSCCVIFSHLSIQYFFPEPYIFTTILRNCVMVRIESIE